MKDKVVGRLIVTMIAGAALLLLNGCAENYTGYESDGGRAQYDQYLDREGYYDFGRPVIFVPDDRTGLN
jgi:hypothetical protein